MHKVALLNFLWFGDNMHCGLSVLPPFVVTRAYHPPGVEESRTLVSEGVVGFRFVFSAGVRFETIFFLRFQILVQHLCLQYSGTAIMCVLQVYSTCVCGTVVRHMCVQYSGTAPVCSVQWYNTCVCSTVRGCWPEGTCTVRCPCRSP